MAACRSASDGRAPADRHPARRGPAAGNRPTTCSTCWTGCWPPCWRGPSASSSENGCAGCPPSTSPLVSSATPSRCCLTHPTAAFSRCGRCWKSAASPVTNSPRSTPSASCPENPSRGPSSCCPATATSAGSCPPCSTACTWTPPPADNPCSLPSTRCGAWRDGVECTPRRCPWSWPPASGAGRSPEQTGYSTGAPTPSACSNDSAKHCADATSTPRPAAAGPTPAPGSSPGMRGKAPARRCAAAWATAPQPTGSWPRSPVSLTPPTGRSPPAYPRTPPCASKPSTAGTDRCSPRWTASTNHPACSPCGRRSPRCCRASTCPTCYWRSPTGPASPSSSPTSPKGPAAPRTCTCRSVRCSSRRPATSVSNRG